MTVKSYDQMTPAERHEHDAALAGKLTAAQYAEQVHAGSEAFNAKGSGATGREALASAAAAKSSDAEVQAFNRIAQLAMVNALPELAQPTSEAEYNERFWACHAKAAALGFDLRFEPSTGTVGIYHPGGIRDTSSTLPAIEREIALRAFKQQQARQYEATVQAPSRPDECRHQGGRPAPRVHRIRP